MLLYSSILSPRLQYISSLFAEELGTGIELTGDLSFFGATGGAKINYSNQRISNDEVWIKPHQLLFEQNIHRQAIDSFLHNGQQAFFQTEGDHPFDVFAAAFYLVTRYEEYGSPRIDAYGRYDHHESLAYKKGFLHLPLVDIWLKDFKCLLQSKFNNEVFNEKTFRFFPTYDIDEAFSYRYKGPLRTVAGISKAVLAADLSEIRNRVLVWKGQQKDPFDVYEWMDDLHKTYQLSPRYFFLVPQKLSRYDRNVSPGKEVIKTLIRKHAETYTIGVHPSWQSGDQPALIKEEIKTIENITGKPVRCSRQHFIRFRLPSTFRHLIEAGIREDFSMGYGSINGFRASMATPFYWFDLENNTTTELLLYPFCYMEANSFFEQKQNPQQALEEMKSYFETVRSVNGCFISIWHNTLLGTAKLFEGWRSCYAEFMAYVFNR